MTTQDAEEFTQAIGQVMAGGYRIILQARKLGVPQALGLTTEEWVQTRLGGYVRLAIPERREVIKELVAEGMTQRQIGEVLGMNQSTIARDLDANAPKKGPSKDKDDANASTSKEKILSKAEQKRIDDEISKMNARDLNTKWICGLSVFDPGEQDPKEMALEILENFNYKAAHVAVELTVVRYRKIAKVIAAIAEGLKQYEWREPVQR